MLLTYDVVCDPDQVVEVVNGDGLVVKVGDSTFKKIFLASIRPPRSWCDFCLSLTVMLWVCCLVSLQRASVFWGWICSDSCVYCLTEIKAADQTCYLTPSKYTNMGQPVPVLTLWRQAPSHLATGVSIFESLVWLTWKKARQGKQGSNTCQPLSR